MSSKFLCICHFFDTRVFNSFSAYKLLLFREVVGLEICSEK